MNKKFIGFFVIVVFILPLITLLATVYTIYLKYEMNTLQLQIRDLRNEAENFFQESFSINNINKKEINTQINIKPIQVKYDLIDINYYNLLNESKTSFTERNKGAIRKFENEKDVLEEAFNAIKNDVPFYIFINNNNYYLYREDYDVDEEQRVFFVQLYLFTAPQYAFIPSMTLRKAEVPVYVFNGKFQQSNEDYYAIASGFFFERYEAVEYRDNMPENMIRDLTGLSVNDRFLKFIYFEGN